MEELFAKNKVDPIPVSSQVLADLLRRVQKLEAENSELRHRLNVAETRLAVQARSIGTLNEVIEMRKTA